MLVRVTTTTGSTFNANLRRYAFPKKGNAPEGYTLLGADGAGLTAATTGGGRYPTYTYVMLDGVSWYFPKESGAVPSGSTVVVVQAASQAAMKVVAVPKGLSQADIDAAIAEAFSEPAAEPAAESAGPFVLTLRYVDGGVKTKTYKTLKAAAKAYIHAVGRTNDGVSEDGVVVASMSGATFDELLAA